MLCVEESPVDPKRPGFFVAMKGGMTMKLLLFVLLVRWVIKLFGKPAAHQEQAERKGEVLHPAAHLMR